MRKILFLIPILFAYGLILGHNLIPHTHHSTNEVTHTSSHHHHDEASHHSHDDEQKNSDKETDWTTIFAHLFHSPFTTVIEHTVISADYGTEIKVKFNDFISETTFQFHYFKAAKTESPPGLKPIFNSHFYPRYFSLRAPPVF